MMEETTPMTARDGSSDGGFSTDLPEILRALRRRPWIVLASVVALASAFYVGSKNQPKVYRGVATIVIDPDLPKVLGEGFNAEDFVTDRASAETSFYNTQYDIIRSRSIVRKAIAELVLTEDRDFLEDHNITAATGEARTKSVEDVVSGRLEVAPERQSRIVKIIFEDYDADRAARIANAVSRVYIDQSLESRLSTTRSASKWLDERVEEYGKQLETTEKQLNDFKTDNKLLSVSLEDRKNMTSTSLGALNERVMQVRAKLIELEAERRVLQSATSSAAYNRAELAAVPRVGRSAVVAQLKGILVELQRSRADLMSRYGERHPNMAAVDNQIAEVTKLYETELRIIVATLNNEITEAKTAEASLLAQLDVETQKALDINKLSLEYGKLSREVANTKQIYESLRKRQTEAGLSGQLESNFVRWLETAEPRPRPVRPSVPMNTGLGALLGLILGVSVVIAGLLLDNTVHTQSDIEERLQLSFLGLLPTIRREEAREEKRQRAKAKGNEKEPATPNARDLHIVKFPTSSVAECVRSLRTNLLFLGTEKPLKRLLFTSAGPSEGKSTTVVALGTTMALAGNRTVMVDTDLRRPRLHKTFGVSGEEGLTSVLLETCELETAIKSTEVRGLDILPSGPLPPNPSELFHTQRFLKLVEMLSERYDRVLFDSPPINAVTDATILSKIVDGTILVIKASKTTKEAARRASRQLLDVNANVLGVVLNDVDIEEGGYYKNYYYYQYRHGYAAGQPDDKS